MPHLPSSSFSPRFPFTSGHLQTLYPTLFRTIPPATPQRRRLETDDGDFIDVDWHFAAAGSRARRLAVISHGLEGSSRRKNVLAMALLLQGSEWDVLCLNCRGCSGEMNRLPRLYHSGVTDDLHRVLCYGLAEGGYDSAVLIGFSMGGNQTLKYLGEAPDKVPEAVRAAAVFSVPVELGDSGARMARGFNCIYTRYFLRGLKDKVEKKAKMYPGLYDTARLKEIGTLFQFDDLYTGPIHGFTGAVDYYAKCSSRQFLKNIRLPTLLVQAEDDPFLPPSCYPVEDARQNTSLFLETPRHGGHMGFVVDCGADRYWLENRALGFFQELAAPDYCRQRSRKEGYKKGLIS